MEKLVNQSAWMTVPSLLVLAIAHNPGHGPFQRFPGIEIIGVPDLDPVLALLEGGGGRRLGKSAFGGRGEFRQVVFQSCHDGEAHRL
jgi:hypothetical protein